MTDLQYEKKNNFNVVDDEEGRLGERVVTLYIMIIMTVVMMHLSRCHGRNNVSAGKLLDTIVDNREREKCSRVFTFNALNRLPGPSCPNRWLM